MASPHSGDCVAVEGRRIRQISGTSSAASAAVGGVLPSRAEQSAVQIVTFYSGMPPEVMELDIMSRLEQWTGQAVGIEHQEAKAMQGVCVVDRQRLRGCQQAPPRRF
jgi:hypothetical protein